MELTTRERQILTLILQEKTSKDIAEQLYLSKYTISNYRKQLMKKTESKTLIGLVKWAIRNGRDY